MTWLHDFLANQATAQSAGNGEVYPPIRTGPQNAIRATSPASPYARDRVEAPSNRPAARTPTLRSRTQDVVRSAPGALTAARERSVYDTTWSDVGRGAQELTGLPSLARGAGGLAALPAVARSGFLGPQHALPAAGALAETALGLAGPMMLPRSAGRVAAPVATEAAQPIPRIARQIGPNGMPIAQSQPYRNSLRGGSSDLREAAGMGVAPERTPALSPTTGQEMPVAHLRQAFDPYRDNPWHPTRSLRVEDVQRAMREGRVNNQSYGGSGWSLDQHRDRIATLARDGWGDPVLLENDGRGIYDGMHRLAAAIARGDDTIRVRREAATPPPTTPTGTAPFGDPRAYPPSAWEEFGSLQGGTPEARGGPLGTRHPSWDAEDAADMARRRAAREDFRSRMRREEGMDARFASGQGDAVGGNEAPTLRLVDQQGRERHYQFAAGDGEQYRVSIIPASHGNGHAVTFQSVTGEPWMHRGDTGAAKARDVYRNVSAAITADARQFGEERYRLGGLDEEFMRLHRAMLGRADRHGDLPSGYSVADDSDGVASIVRSPPRPLRGGTPEARLRAQEQGFDTGRVLYHGTENAIDGPLRPSRDGASGAGIYTTDDPDYASYFARWRGEEGEPVTGAPTVIPVYGRGRLAPQGEYDRIKNQHVDARMARIPRDSDGAISDTERFYRELELANQDTVRDLQAMGYAGVESSRYAGEGAIVYFDPRNIRSIFAAFDPAKRDSSDLLAGLTAAAPIPIAASALTQQQNTTGRPRGRPGFFGGR